MGGEAGDADLRSTREGQTASPQNGMALWHCSQGRTLRQARQHKQTVDSAAWGYEGWICSSELLPAVRLHAMLFAQRRTS
jgi:hypothetical protein